MITIDDFIKIDLRVGTVLEAEAVAGSEKLIRQTVDFGELGKRQILSGIKKSYTPSQLLNKQFIYVVNLEPRMMMGLESQGMLLCAIEELTEERKLTLLKPLKKVSSGTKVG